MLSGTAAVHSAVATTKRDVLCASRQTLRHTSLVQDAYKWIQVTGH